MDDSRTTTSDDDEDEKDRIAGNPSGSNQITVATRDTRC